jgi:GDP-D-mannose 3',5'-epimerase
MGRGILVAGAGGFIGGHLVRMLREQGCFPLRAVDKKPLTQWFQRFDGVDNRVLDLSDKAACEQAADGMGTVYNLASDMGGMGFIERHKAQCMLSVLINTHLLMAARQARADAYFFASSACVYNAAMQTGDGVALKEADAYPAMPEDGYGWEKLFGERMCRHFSEDFGLPTRVARLHNIYGPFGTFDGGREKAPAALARKVAEAKLNGHGEIEIWGDGRQLRSFTFIDDCLAGIGRIMAAPGLDGPLNLGSSEMVSIDGLVDIIEDIAGTKLLRRYNPAAPKGVRGRNSDNTRIEAALGWSPSIPLRQGMETTYRWIYDQLASGRPDPRFCQP